MKLVTNAHPAPDRDEEAALWCLALSEGGLSPDQQFEFDAWHADPENASAFQRAADTWDTVELIAGVPEIIQMRSDALDAYRLGTLRRGNRNKTWRKTAWRMGPAIAAAITILIGWFALPDRSEFHTGIGERRVAMLEDGSRLSLDADSDVTVRFDSSHRALVLTHGRARFDVAHNPLRPFTVSVGDKMVVATGTSFSVEMIAGGANVALLEGRVAVLDAAGRPVALTERATDVDAVLAPGNVLRLPIGRGGPGRLARSDADETLRWQQGQLGFDDVALPIAVERMNRYLHEPLVVGDAGAARVRVSGIFDGGDASAFIDALRQLNGIRADRRSGKIFLTKG